MADTRLFSLFSGLFLLSLATLLPLPVHAQEQDDDAKYEADYNLCADKADSATADLEDEAREDAWRTTFNQCMEAQGHHEMDDMEDEAVEDGEEDPNAPPASTH